MAPRSGQRLVGCLLALFVAACGRSSDPATGQAVPADKLESPAVVPANKIESPAAAPASAVAFPALRLQLVDGSNYDIASHRGKWVVVNFWATWCTPCVKEMPELSALHDAHDDVNVVGLDFEQIEPEALREALARRPVSYPVAIVDPYKMPPGIAAPRGLPMTYLVDPRGNVKRQFLGPVTRESMERAIAAP